MAWNQAAIDMFLNDYLGCEHPLNYPWMSFYETLQWTHQIAKQSTTEAVDNCNISTTITLKEMWH